MKKLALLIPALISLALFADPPDDVGAPAMLSWQNIVALAELAFVPEDPSALQIIPRSITGTTSVVTGGHAIFHPGHGAGARSLGTASVAGGVVSWLGAVAGMGNAIENRDALKRSPLIAQIKDKLGETRTAELVADLRAHTGLVRLVRDYGDSKQSAKFLTRFRAEREKLSGLVPEHAMGKNERQSALDIGAARRAAMLVVMETSTDRQKSELQQKLDEDLKAIAESMKNVPPAPAVRPVATSPGTH